MVNATELKEELGSRAKDIIADGIGLVGNRNKKVSCPLHHDTNPSMSWYQEGLMWRCHSCQGHIDIYSYYTDFEHMEFKDAVNKVGEMLGKTEEPIRAAKTEYVLPNIKTKELSQEALEYMSKRKITKETLDHWRVKQHIWNGKEVYVFQYFNEKDKLVYVSYRGIGKGTIKGGCETNTKPILWGMWNIDKTKPLVITEGQPDAMAVWQSGYKNVVSVPNGSNNLKWIDHNWEWLQGVKEFIVFADNDAPGLEMAMNIKRKLHNVKIVQADRKDANEVLFYDGPSKVKELIQNSINEMPKGITDLAEVEFKSSMDASVETIETGFYEYDSYVEDWKMQEITIIFGRNGEGKTTFISQIIAHCLEKKQKTFLYSGEMSDNKIQDWLYRQMIGTKKEYLRTIITKYREKIEPTPEAIKRIKEWHKGTLYLYDRNEKELIGDLDKFFNVMGIAARRYGVKLFIIDNLMAILEENADSLYSDQANFVQRCKQFALDNNSHVVLLAHPNKEKKELKDALEGNLEKTDISGSNNIGNKADNIIAVERLWVEGRDCDAIITSLKDRDVGQRKQLKYYFSHSTLRFYNKITPENKDYGWEKKITPTEKMKPEPEGFQLKIDKNCPF